MPKAIKKRPVVKVTVKRRVNRPATKKHVAISDKLSAERSNSKSHAKTQHSYLAAVGRRKSAVARVRLMTKGTGQVMINNQTVDKYFVLPEYVNTVLQPLQLTGLDKSVDVGVMVSGGGKVGQSIAVRHGIARALLLLDENYRKQLRPAGYLTRDARVKERKKPGLKRARRAPQFSKR